MDESEIANYADGNTPYSIDDEVISKLKLDYIQFSQMVACKLHEEQ